MNNKPKILLIDDEPDILEVVGLLLQTEGFEIETAISGEVALQKLANTKYDIVICDYLMPVIDGIELLKQVRSKKDYTPFIFFSGNADESHVPKMAGLGAYQLLPKSQIHDLANVLKHTLKIDAELQQIDFESKDQDEFLEILHSV